MARPWLKCGVRGEFGEQIIRIRNVVIGSVNDMLVPRAARMCRPGGGLDSSLVESDRRLIAPGRRRSLTNLVGAARVPLGWHTRFAQRTKERVVLGSSNAANDFAVPEIVKVGSKRSTSATAARARASSPNCVWPPMRATRGP